MNLTDFIAQAHPSTLDWIEEKLMEQLLVVDTINKKLACVRSFREIVDDCNDHNIDVIP